MCGKILWVGSLLGCLLGTGCVAPTQFFTPVSNPVFVAASSEEVVWERTVDVIHAYHFPIARENRLDRVIETGYFAGSGLLEPWHHDSVGFEERLQSTLQSIRRRMVVNFTPSEGGYLVGVQAYKELEYIPGEAANSPGGATFQENTPLERDLDQVVGQTTPSVWIPQGRDPKLETAILRSIRAQF